MDNNQNPYEKNAFEQAGQNGENQYYQNNVGNQTMQNTNWQNNYNTQPPVDETVSVLDWVGTILLAAVPCVGLIVYIVWAFSADTKKSKANYCKANLIIMLAVVALYIVLAIILVALGVTSSLYY